MLKKLFFSVLICFCIINVAYVFGQDDDESAAATTEIPTTTTEKSKANKKVNWTEVEMKWNEILDDDIVHEKWKKLDENLKNGIKSVLKAIFPKVVSMSSDTKVSSNCTAGMLKWVLSLRNLKDWSVKMLDAIGKPSAGLLDGSITMFGNYRQCLGIRAYEDDEELDDDFFNDGTEPKKPVEKKEFFRGKYCILEFKPYLPKKPAFYGLNTKLKALQIPVEEDSIFKLLTDHAVLLNIVNLRFDLCVPSLCEREDIQKIVSFLSKLIDFRGRVSRCETEPEVPVSFNFSQLIAVSSLIVLILLFGASSVFAFLLFYCKFKGTLSKLAYNLSWQHSYRELEHFASYQKSHLKAPVLYGIRYIILFWIMLVHTATIVNFQFLRDMLPMKDLALSQPAQLVTKSSIQFDALILITAFTMGFVCENKSTAKVGLYVTKKFFRLMPAIMIIVALFVLLPIAKPFLDGGATWSDIVEKPSKACESYGLINFLFIQNFFSPSESCLPHTWIFAVEMQLAVIFLIVLGIRHHYLQIGTFINIALIAIGFIVNVITVSRYRLPPTYLITLPDIEQRDYYFQVHYFKPWTHLSTFGCGILAGCYVSKLKKLELARRKRSANIHYSKSSNPTFMTAVYLFGWIVCLTTLASVIFSYNDWIKGDLPDPISSGFYDASQRLSWSLAQCYILYFLICVLNEKSKISRFLSNKLFIFLGRLCLLAYIIHPVWQLIFLSTQHTAIYSSKFVALYSMMGNITISFLLAGVISLFLEIPISSLLMSRSIVSTKHPVKPLLGRKLPTNDEKNDDFNMYSVSDVGTDFRMQNNNNNMSHPNHNEFVKENYKF